MGMVINMKKSTYLLFAAAMLYASCCSDNDEMTSDKYFAGYGKPMQITLGEEGNNGTTRGTTPLSTNKTVFITPDVGQTKWYAYTYDSGLGLWKATKEFNSTNGTTWTSTTTTQGLIWTSENMLLYAVVRNDSKPTATDAGPLTDNMVIAADQTTEAKFNAQAVLGTVERVTYTTGKISLTLHHILGKVVCDVSNITSPDSWTCTSWGAGQHSTPSNNDNNGTVNGEMGNNVNDVWGYYFSQGKLSIGDDQFTFQPIQGSLENFQCWRFYSNASNKKAKFCCWMIPLSNVGVCFCFKLVNGSTVKYTKNRAYGGVALLPGCTTTQFVDLP